MKKQSWIILAAIFSSLLICSSVYPAFAQNKGIINKGFPEDIANSSKQQQQDSRYIHKTFLDKVGTKNDGNLVRFGFKIGMNLSNMNFNKGYSGVTFPLNQAWKTGFLIGLKMEIPLWGKLYLNQEYLFSRVGGEFQPFASIYVLDYLSLPVLLKYRFFGGFSIMAGPNFGLLIKGKEFKGGQSFDVTKMTEERNVGITIGLFYPLTENIGINARFMQGLNQVGIFQRSGRREFKYEVIHLSAEIFL